MRLYLDLCCLNRRFDDQSQPRIARETAAVQDLLEAVVRGEHEFIDSEALRIEIANHPVALQRVRLIGLLALASTFLPVRAGTAGRCRALLQAGFGALDALHLASAEDARADAFVTVDDALTRRAARYHGLTVAVHSPVSLYLRGQR